MKIFENLVKIEDIGKFGQNWRFLKILSKLKIFENLVEKEDFWNFGQNWRFFKFWSKWKIFQILVKIEDIGKEWWISHKKIKKVSMLGFEHFSHMVTHPSTDEAQCCLSLEISKNDFGRRKKKSRL